MKRHLRPFFLLGIVGSCTLFGIFILQKEPLAISFLRPRQPIVIVAFGNSLSAGLMVRQPDINSFPALLEKSLRSRGLNVVIINRGVSGHTSRDALQRLDSDIPDSADIVLVEFGTNDFSFNYALSETQRNLEEIVRRIHRRGAAVLLFEHKAFRQVPRTDADIYEAIYPRVAHSTGAVLVPDFLEGVMGRRWMNNPDMVHPNGRGHRRIRTNIEPYVQKAVMSRIEERQKL